MTKAKAARAPAPKPDAMTDGELADAHRNWTMAKVRAGENLKAIEAELERRGLHSAQGRTAFVSKQLGDIGLIDWKKLRAALGEAICREYAVPGSDVFWRSRVQKLDERSAGYIGE